MSRIFLSRALAARQSSINRSAVHISSRSTSTSALYGMSALGNRNETQYFSKISRLPLMEHSLTLKLIHTSEVQLGSRSPPINSPPAKKEQEQNDVAILASGLKDVRTQRELQEEEDQALFTDFSARKEYKKDIAELKEQICRKQIRFLEERIESGSLARHLEGAKLDKKSAQSELASNSQADRALSVQQQRSDAATQGKVESAALEEYRRDIALLNEQVYTREIKSFQMQLDSSKVALARVRKSLGKDAESKPILERSQQTGQPNSEESSGHEARAAVLGAFMLGGILSALYGGHFKVTLERDDNQSIPMDTSRGEMRSFPFPEYQPQNWDLQGKDTHNSGEVDRVVSGDAPQSNENNLEQTLNETMNMDTGADRQPLKDVSPTSEAASPAIPFEKPESVLIWNRFLWKKQ